MAGIARFADDVLASDVMLRVSSSDPCRTAREFFVPILRLACVRAAARLPNYEGVYDLRTGWLLLSIGITSVTIVSS